MARIHWDVALIPQQSSNSCWFACARMIAKWHHGFTAGGSVVGRGLFDPAVTEAVHEINRPLQTSDAASFAAANRLQATHAPLSRDTLLQWVGGYGPLIYSGRLNGFSGLRGQNHAVVITGCDSNGASLTVEINDPQPVGMGARRVLSFEELTNTLPWNLFPVLHI